MPRSKLRSLRFICLGKGTAGVCGTGCARLLAPRSAYGAIASGSPWPGRLWESDVFWNDSAASMCPFALDMAKLCESAVSESLSEPTLTRVQPERVPS